MTSKWPLRKDGTGEHVGYQKWSVVVLVTKLAPADAAATAVTIVSWPAAAISISLIAATVLMMRWILCSPERTRHLVTIISALRSKGTIPSPGGATLQARA
jgi:hypothetical protein